MQAIFEVAAKITTGWSLAAFAIAAILFLATRKASLGVRRTLYPVVGAIVLLALVPIIGGLYTDSRDKLYIVRAVVINPDKTPVDDAKVWSSQGGEPKKVQGGWQFDIPAVSVSKDQKLTVYATVDAAFLRGQGEVALGSDFHPNLTIELKHSEVNIRGLVKDENDRAVEGALVGVVGYGNEMVRTKADGGFEVPAHASDGQQVQLHAEKSGLKAGEGWYPAGTPAEIVLSRK